MALRVKGQGSNKQTDSGPSLALTPRPLTAGLQYPCPWDLWTTWIILKSYRPRETEAQRRVGVHVHLGSETSHKLC